MCIRYYELGIKWVPNSAPHNRGIKTIDFHNFAGPGDFNPFNQNNYIFTFQCPTDHDSIFWYSGRMPYTGDMLRNKLHGKLPHALLFHSYYYYYFTAHNKIFKEAIFFAAAPDELGLTAASGLFPSRPYLTVDIQQAGFADLSAVKLKIMDSLVAAQSVFDGKVSRGETVSDTDGTTSRTRPAAICHGTGQLAEVEGYFYDRREPICCVPWHVTAGDIFTVVGFNRKLEYKMGPHTDVIPATFPGHIGFWISTASEEDAPTSRFSIGQYNQNPNGIIVIPDNCLLLFYWNYFCFVCFV